MADPVYIRSGLAVGALTYMYRTYGFWATAVAWRFLSATNLLPVFRLLYKLYTGKLGYLLKNYLHPRNESHSVCVEFRDVPGVVILPVAIMEDNYSYLIWCADTKRAAVVDPADPAAVMRALPQDVKLTHILCTHKHWDHAGGNVELNKLFRETLVIVGSAIDSPHGMTQEVTHGDHLDIGNIAIDVLHAPGHTDGHLIYQVSSSQKGSAASMAKSMKDLKGAWFTGDALFFGGVGAFFEGDCRQVYQTFRMMHLTLDDYFVFCGHEYTMTLLNEALQSDPNNLRIHEALEECSRRRELRPPLCTLPSTLSLEKAINPFLRLDAEWLANAAEHQLCRDEAEMRMMEPRP